MKERNIPNQYRYMYRTSKPFLRQSGTVYGRNVHEYILYNTFIIELNHNFHLMMQKMSCQKQICLCSVFNKGRCVPCGLPLPPKMTHTVFMQLVKPVIKKALLSSVQLWTLFIVSTLTTGTFCFSSCFSSPQAQIMCLRILWWITFPDHVSAWLKFLSHFLWNQLSNLFVIISY